MTVLKNASYPITGSNDSSQWVAGAGRIETGLTASTNEGAIESAFAAGDSRRAQIAREALAALENK